MKLKFNTYPISFKTIFKTINNKSPLPTNLMISPHQKNDIF